MSTKLQVMSAYYAERRARAAGRLGEGDRPTAAVLGPVLVVLSLLIWGAGMAFGFNVSLWLFVVLGFLLAIVGLGAPAAGVFGIAILVALEPVTRVYLPAAGPFRFNTLPYWLIVVILLHIPSLLRLNDLQTRILQFFILLLALELMFSTRLAKGVQQLLEISTMFGMLVYFARARGERMALFWTGIVVGVIGAVGGLVFNLQITSLPYLNPNAWAFFPATVLFTLCLAFLDTKGSARRVFALVALFTINYAWIFLSGSRGNMLTGLICLLFILWQGRKMPWVMIFLVISALIGYFVATAMQEQMAYALSRVELFFDESSTLAHRTSGRSTLMRGALEIFSKNPLGVGTGSFNDTFAEVDRWGRAKTSHSAWLAVLVENGIPGVLLLVLYLTSFTLVGWSRRREGLFGLGLFITMLMATVFISKEVYVRGLWMLAAAGMVLLNPGAIRQAFPSPNASRALRRFHHLRNDWDVNKEDETPDASLANRPARLDRLDRLKTRPPARIGRRYDRD